MVGVYQIDVMASGPPINWAKVVSGLGPPFDYFFRLPNDCLLFITTICSVWGTRFLSFLDFSIFFFF